MIGFMVTIIETLEKAVMVKAMTRKEAEKIVSDDWCSCKHVLDAGNFESVKFVAREICADERI